MGWCKENLLYYLEIYIYNLNYLELTKYNLINKDINILIKKKDLDFNKIINKILKGNNLKNLYFYFAYDLKLLLNILAYRPLFLSIILEELIINLLQSKNFDTNLLIKINQYIYNELYYEIIEIINRFKLNMKILKEDLEILEKKNHAFYDVILEPLKIKKINEIDNYIKSIEGILNL